MKSIEKLVIEAAIAWWEGKRPCSFTLEEHLENPTINVGKSTLARELAAAVGALLHKRAKRPPQYDSDGMHLAVQHDGLESYIAWWADDTGEGMQVGQEGDLVKRDRELAIVHDVMESFAKANDMERDSRASTWKFSSEAKARAAMRQLNTALSLASNPLPRWASVALKEGWVPPEGWEP